MEENRVVNGIMVMFSSRKLEDIVKIVAEKIALGPGGPGAAASPYYDDIGPDNVERDAGMSSIKYLSDKPFQELGRGDAGYKYVVIGLDSSTRMISTPFLSIAVVAATVYSRILGELYDVPPLMPSYPLNIDPPPSIAVLGVRQPWHEEGLEGVVTRSPAGVPYDKSYNRFILLDELRTTTETYLLQGLIGNMGKLSLRGRRPFIFIDGPVYHTPLLLRQHYGLIKSGGRSRGRLDEYVESWRVMLSNRVRALREGIDKGIPIAGVVKRLEKSSLLPGCGEYHDVLRRNGLDFPIPDNDQAFIDVLITWAMRRRLIGYPLKPLLIGPFRIEPSASLISEYVEDAPVKIAYYYVMPLYRYARIHYRVFRIEYIEPALDFLDENPHTPVIQDTLGAGSVLPLSILYADKRAKALSRSLSYMVARYLELGGLPLTYDALREYEERGML